MTSSLVFDFGRDPIPVPSSPDASRSNVGQDQREEATGSSVVAASWRKTKHKAVKRTVRIVQMANAMKFLFPQTWNFSSNVHYPV